MILWITEGGWIFVVLVAQMVILVIHMAKLWHYRRRIVVLESGHHAAFQRLAHMHKEMTKPPQERRIHE